MSQELPPFFHFPSYLSLLADPFLERVPVASAPLPFNLAVTKDRLSKLLKRVEEDGKDSVGLTLFTDEDVAKLNEIVGLLEPCIKFTDEAAKVEVAEQFPPLLEAWKKQIDELPDKKLMLVPGGWTGLQQEATIMHIIERSSRDTYSFTTLNKGAGLDYHQSHSAENDLAPPKIKYKTSLRINNIPAQRIKDIGFWATFFSMWLKASEYHRAEVVYDVLLPWLSEHYVNPQDQSIKKRDFSQAISETIEDPWSDWRTPQRSGSSGPIRSIMEAIRYILRYKGLSREQMKQFSFVFKRQMLNKAVSDLISRYAQKNSDKPGVPEAIKQAQDVGLLVEPDDKEEDSSSSSGDPSSQTSLDFEIVLGLIASTGSTLINSKGEEVDLDSLSDKPIGLYFSAHWCGPCRVFTPQLSRTYEKLKSEGNEFEIIFISSDKSEEEFKTYFSTMPWTTISSFADSDAARTQLKTLLGITGIPTLVLFNSVGKLLTKDGRRVILQDPQGLDFPWNNTMKPQLHQVIEILGAASVIDGNNQLLDASTSLNNKVVGLYFSGHWCPPCKTFTPILKGAYQAIKANDKKTEDFEVLFISSDKSDAEFREYFKTMPWLAIPFQAVDKRKQLMNMFKVEGIPTLLLFNPDGSLFSASGTKIVAADAKGKAFPWYKPSETGETIKEEPALLNDVDVQFLQLGLKQFAYSADKENTQGRLAAKELIRAKNVIDAVEKLIEVVPKSMLPNGGLPPELAVDRAAPVTSFLDCHLLVKQDVESYAGPAARLSAPQLVNLLDVPQKVTTAAQATNALVICEGVCKDLLDRARETGTASRFVLQMQIIQLITTLFLEIIPVGAPLDGTLEQFHSNVWASGSLTADQQMTCLTRIHRLARIYTAMWQQIENPTRGFDSERSLVAAAMLAIYDSALRVAPPAPEKTLQLTELLMEDGGWRVDTGLCMDRRAFQKVNAFAELTVPEHTRAREAVIDYFESLERVCANRIFELRQPLKIEIQKYGSTVMFMKKFMERTGHQFRNNPGRAEIETLMYWFLDNNSPIATKNREFTMYRDMAALYKFLSTMETQESELVRRRVEMQQMQRWTLTFDESGNTYAWNSNIPDLEWDAMGFRGRDMNIADVQVKFGDRELLWGEGPVTKSPADLSSIIGIERPTEDDVLHAEALQLFSHTLSREEAELLYSYLTVPYVRIPLVVGFFASQDRVTFLFNPQLQQLVRAVLFEGGPWVSMDKYKKGASKITSVPVRRSLLQEKDFQKNKLMFANFTGTEEVELLGTPQGLLLNELHNSPAATLGPLMSMFESIKDLSDSNAHSNDATFIIYLVELAIDVQSYVLYAIEEEKRQQAEDKGIEGLEQNLVVLEEYYNKIHKFLHGLAGRILSRWRDEATENGDIPTACVMHSYEALLWNSLPGGSEGKMTQGALEALLGHIGYCRNWYSFGLRQKRVDLMWGDDDSSTDPRERLLRFLQAQGINTSSIRSHTLDQYVDRKAPLVLRVGERTVVVPQLHRVKDAEKLPPADVPEARLFHLLQRHRRSMVNWLTSAAKENSGAVLQNIVKIALDSPDFEYINWKHQGAGRFVAEEPQIKVDVQTAEILWKNDSLKPLPDSMTQFIDFKTLFGSEAFQCGSISRSSHRHWVNVVGTPYELQEWDTPDSDDQGVGVPKVPPPPPDPRDSLPCSFCGSVGAGCWTCSRCTVINCSLSAAIDDSVSLDVCSTCGTTKADSRKPVPQEGAGGGGQGQGGRGQRGQPKKVVGGDEVIYNEVTYNRAFDIYSKDPHPEEAELWAVQLLQKVLLHVYPPMPPAGRLEYKLLLPKDPYKEDAKIARFIGVDKADKPQATWKEMVVLKERKVVHVYNLVSHGRRMFRTLVYSSDGRFSLQSLPLLCTGGRAASVIKEVKYESGEFKKLRVHGPTLNIIRRNQKIGGNETYVPPRLLQGVMPSVLLESFHMWQGEDGVIRGEPQEKGMSQWFNYNLEVSFNEGNKTQWNASIIRRPLTAVVTKISEDADYNTEMKGWTKRSLTRSGSDLHLSGRSVQSMVGEVVVADLIEQLEAMGFSNAGARLALRKNYNSIERAANWLFDPSNRAEIEAFELSSFEQEPIHVVQQAEEKRSKEKEKEVAGGGAPKERSIRSSSSGDYDGKLQVLVESGFPAPAASHALRIFGGDMAVAESWLRDESNQYKIKKIIGATKPEEARTMEVDPTASRSGDLALINLLEAEEGSALYRLGTMLARIEDMSHVLVWTTSHPSQLTRSIESSGLSKISVIEFPRLKVRFQPIKDMDTGIVRLYCLDHSGWYITDSVANYTEEEYAHRPELQLTRPPAAEYLNQLLQGIENCLVLENNEKQLQIFIPNHDCHRPAVQGQPFSKSVVTDRSCMGWQQVMESRYYLYPVHSSMTFLKPQTLGASLYLVLIKFLNRDYTGTFNLINACCVDTKFTDEESWIFDQFSRTMTDLHPDAHACRLRLTLAVLFSDNRYKWEVHEEMDSYLAKTQHTSGDCVLTAEEELDVLYACKKGTPRIRNRLEYLKAAIAYSTNSPKAPSTVHLKTLPVKVAGQPWLKLITLSGEYLENRSVKLTRLHYKRPGDEGSGFINDDKALEPLWDDLVLSDEESGANQQLGFLFLYEALRGRVVMTVANDNISSSLGEILARYFHLKQARWGEENADDGEQEYRSSYQMAELAAVLLTPGAPWQPVPEDAESKKFLENGVNIFSREVARSMVKSWYDLMSVEFRTAVATPQHQELVEMFRKVLSDTKDYAAALSSVVVSLAPEIERWRTKHRPNAFDSACEQRILEAKSIEFGNESLTVTDSDIQFFSTIPLGAVDVQNYVEYIQYDKTCLNDLPFSIEKHPTSQSIVAKKLLSRLSEDVSKYASKMGRSKVPRIKGLLDEHIVEFAENPNSPALLALIESLDDLTDKLHTLQKKDSVYAAKIISMMQLDANRVHFTSDSASGTSGTTEQDIHRYKFLLQRYSGQKSYIDVSFISAVLLSKNAKENLMDVNPFISNVDQLLTSTATLMLHCNRIGHANRAIVQASNLKALLLRLHSPSSSSSFTSSSGGSRQLTSSSGTAIQTDMAWKGSSGRANLRSSRNQPSSIPKDFLERLRFTSLALAETLCTKRTYVKSLEQEAAAVNQTNPLQKQYQLDPRFLIFEYIFDIIIRARQVEMVNDFVRQVRAGGSPVQQMIMGQGKTTVVGPLLTLILADGDSLVTQVMPTALLEQTRNVLRGRFSSIIMKRVYTLEFDRSLEDSVEVVAKLFAKLETARKGRHVICAAPESVKSLMLKFIEHLHVIEEVENSGTLLNNGNNNNKTISKAAQMGSRTQKELSHLREQMVAKSDMADALVKILDIWKSGTLIMDEVDILLHPLRSELNFPIGHKQAIDLSGHRWDLPIHLIDSIFYHSRQSICEDLYVYQQAEVKTGWKALDVLNTLALVIEKGYASHALQRNPHLVLLDQKFYHSEMKPVLCKWTLLWLHNHFEKCDVSDQVLLDYLSDENMEENRSLIESNVNSTSKKLLNLASSWMNNLLPHVLAKIDRVSFGILSPADIALVDARTPKSRLLMAVPFVGKDVPSRASEFAHPDALIGLTILAYRYEGVRQSDVSTVVSQLKQDYSRQTGDREKRPASIIFRSWLNLAKLEDHSGSGSSSSSSGSSGSSTSSGRSVEEIAAVTNNILPLSLFAPTDKKQLSHLYSLIRHLPQMIHYYLRQHIFPACMNFQKLKVSASGHELGSNILFGRRIGFSGTPSNLLPKDLGECQYEPGSDGQVVNTLTSDEITSFTFLESGWSARTLLKRLATESPPFHALIDTGALITGMDNEEVAHFLLLHLPPWFEGVVYLDRQDRKMILLRSSGRSMLLAQCGVSPDRRFSFYDQVHTTGMDIVQAPSARAVVTLGKDMTFRDYAQGAFRMRGIGKGQTIHLYIIPEVRNRMSEELGKLDAAGKGKKVETPLLDAPAWLLINSMRMESLQFVKLCSQELWNVYRKKGLKTLTDEVEINAFGLKQSGTERLLRFVDTQHTDSSTDAAGAAGAAGAASATESSIEGGAKPLWMRTCIELFREQIGYDVPDTVPHDELFYKKLEDLMNEKADIISDDKSLQLRAQDVLKEVKEVRVDEGELDSHDKDVEVQNEQEQEAQEEAEEEAEEEEQKISEFTRDDEQPWTWDIKILNVKPTGTVDEKGDQVFYKFNQFHVREEQPFLKFPENLYLSDNFFRPRWVGVGDRRLKNVSLVMEWIPDIHNAQADSRFVVALSLAEAETIRRLIHSYSRFSSSSSSDSKTSKGSIVGPSLFDQCAIALRVVEGGKVAESPNFYESLDEEQSSASDEGKKSSSSSSSLQVIDKNTNTIKSASTASALQCLRFFNCDMYYTDSDLELLSHTLSASSYTDRRLFFEENLRLRRRERNLWIDTPLARFLTPPEQWHQLRSSAILQKLRTELVKAIKRRKRNPFNPYVFFEQFDEDKDDKLNSEELRRAFIGMNLPFAQGDYHEVITLFEKDTEGRISRESFRSKLDLPEEGKIAGMQPKKEGVKLREHQWVCQNCTMINAPMTDVCEMCGWPWPIGGAGGMSAVASGKSRTHWMCAGEKGGCTLSNPMSEYYCEACNRARPDYSSTRF